MRQPERLPQLSLVVEINLTDGEVVRRAPPGIQLAPQFRSENLCVHVHITQLRHGLTFRSRKALLMTETELKLIAAPAMIGLSSKPKNGYSTPAATGIPSAL